MVKHKTSLEARVEARNAVNAEYNRLKPILFEAFRPLVGVKIAKKEGGIMEKFKKLIPQGQTWRFNLGSTEYSLSWSIVASAYYTRPHSNGEISVNEEAPLYVAHMKDGMIEKLYDVPEDLPTNFTVADVLAKREAFKKADEIKDAAESACRPFGTRDPY